MFAANGVDIMIDERGGYTPTPVISHAILSYNKGRTSGLADGVVITPSHNPPEDGGYKYNPPHGGPADTDVTAKVEKAANAYMEADMKGVARVPYERARKAPSTHLHDYIRPYVADLGNAVDMALIKSSGVKIGIDPLGGAAVHYWQPLIEHYGINATIVNDAVDPTFRFMTADWDGKDPDGLFLAVCDGEPDCDARQVRRRLCQRHRRRPARHRDAHGRADEPKSFSCRRDRLSVRAPAAMGQRGRDRQDHRLQLDHRPRRKKAEPQAGRNPGRLQMVRRRPRHRCVRICRRGKRRRFVPQARRLGVDDRQGRHGDGAARRRNPRPNRPRSEPVVCRR